MSPPRDERNIFDFSVDIVSLHFNEMEDFKNWRMPLWVANTRYSLVKGERIVRTVSTTRLRASKTSFSLIYTSFFVCYQRYPSMWDDM